MAPRTSNAEMSRRTRETLIAAGRRLFGERGFAATSTEEIVNAASVTRGALYHQFADKTELFEAVLEDVEQEVARRLLERAQGVDAEPRALLEQMTGQFLDLCLEPEIRRIALCEAPSVVGWDKWREIDARYGFGLLRGLLAEAAARGQLEPARVDALAHLFLGAASEAALAIAHAPDDPELHARLRESLTWMIGRIFPDDSGS